MKKRPHVFVFLFALAAYGLTSYAGIRSADGEVVFEVCDSLLRRHSFRVEGESAWKGFGLAPGTDGQWYAIFGPLQSIACVPFLAMADAVDKTHWFNQVDPQRSHTIDGGLRAVLTGAPLAPAPAPQREMHARRSLVAWLFNSLVGALGVLMFFRVCLRIARHDASALLVAGAYAFCGLNWPYSGTFFSEPLATFWLLVSLEAALPGAGMPRARVFSAWLSGVALGLASATHVTAVLFFPFWLAIVAQGQWRRPHLVRAGLALGGAAMVLALLAGYNHVRFGSVWETGRGIRPDEFGYGRFQVPGRALWGLLISPGKGLLLFCPVVFLGVLGWRSFLRQQGRVLAIALALAVATRLMFIAARTDWHGGFSLGPRYLVMAIPLLLLPAVTWVDQFIEDRRGRALMGAMAFLWLCSLQQWTFVVGEIFSYLHFVKWQATSVGVDIFVHDDIYLLPRYSPLFGLLDGFRGPFLFKGCPISNNTLWLMGAAVLSLGWLLSARWLLRRVR